MGKTVTDPAGQASRPLEIRDQEAVAFLQWALPRLQLRWRGFRRVRRQVNRRIRRRLIELGLDNLAAYRRYLEQHADEWTVLDRFCRISISRFYRDRDVFDHLRDRLLPELARRALAEGSNRLDCWTVGCASGEEPYTLALIGRLGLPEPLRRVELAITATDIDRHLLERARQARYERSSLKDLPAAWVDVAFERDGAQYRLKREFTQSVRWLCQDVRRQMPAGPFQLILCRHLVLTYFDVPLQQRVMAGIAARLAPGGLLVTAKKEQLPGGLPQLVAHHPRLGVHRKTD